MAALRLASINMIIEDVDAAARFLATPGLELEPTLPEWEAHHRTIAPGSTDFDDADIDSPAFAHWGEASRTTRRGSWSPSC
jgi:hypothetical protein